MCTLHTFWLQFSFGVVWSQDYFISSFFLALYPADCQTDEASALNKDEEDYVRAMTVDIPHDYLTIAEQDMDKQLESSVVNDDESITNV